jgi:hypothetical protein
MTDPVASLRAMGAALESAAPPVVHDPAIERLRMVLQPDASPADTLTDETRAWHAYYRQIERDISTGAPRNVGPRWWCRMCSAFVREESCMCAKCRDRGPHWWGEEPRNTGNRARRARLRATHKQRHRRH